MGEIIARNMLSCLKLFIKLLLLHLVGCLYYCIYHLIDSELRAISEASVCKFGELAIESNPQIVEAHTSGNPHHKNLPLNAVSGNNPYFL